MPVGVFLSVVAVFFIANTACKSVAVMDDVGNRKENIVLCVKVVAYHFGLLSPRLLTDASLVKR